MKIEEVKLAVENKLQKMVESDANLSNAFLLVHSDKLNIHWNMAFGHTEDAPANEKQPYHTTSIGKTFTAIIIAKLVEEGMLHYDDPISKYLDKDLIHGLHVYKGKDYTNDIRIEHLVSHTSGLPDFFEDEPHAGKSFLQLLLDEPERFWTAQETIEWTKQNMDARFPPGKKCHYTDTGYNLLGLIIERVMSKPYHEVLHEYIFGPLKMNSSYLSQYSTPVIRSEFAVASINLKNKKINVEQHRSFSSFYAGGQTVSTSEDLFKCMKALVENQLIQQQSLMQMKQWRKLWIGVEYGYGLMKVQMLPIIKKYSVWGHLGSTGSFMLYNPVMDVYIIGNFNNNGYVAKSLRFVYYVQRQLSKIKMV
ncbi:serine hydrolase domain-containing protein [Solibacillus sp. FSL H8-0538]|uniref:serine hydrolase domain-containing protein n=1 Tax=Solibacillus sp. FSL H8-0538 TaxID=2921400 RepID=UPI0030FC2C09